jgi:tetratricopeptide (TPR) repeat protein
LRSLWNWQQDRDLAGIRDQAALAKLPTEQQKAFTKLWADVAKAAEPVDPAERLAAVEVAYEGKDQSALDSLVKAHPAAGGRIGDLYAADKSWERAVAAYSKAITPETRDAKLLAKRAEAYEKLKQWDLAVADWTRASQQQPDVAFERFKSAGAEFWRFQTMNGGAGTMEVVDGALVFTTTAVTGTTWDVQFTQGRLQLENGAEYIILFKMKSPDSCTVVLVGAKSQEDWGLIGLGETFVPPSEFRDYEFTFVPHDVIRGNNRIGFDLGTNRGKVMLKEIVLLKNQDAAALQASRSRLVTLARAHAQEGHIDEAVASFSEALDLTADGGGKAKIITEAAAQKGVLEKLAERAVTANGGRLTFAQVAYDQKKFAFAIRLWAEALARDLNLGDDHQAQHRYNAARAAVLAATGQGKDEPPLDDAAKMKLRSEALRWLNTEMIAWSKLVDSGHPRDRLAIVKTLSHWHKNIELTGIRDAAALAKLPPDEQKAFTQLWADAAALLKKAEAMPK